MIPVMQERDDYGSWIPGSFAAVDNVQFELHLPNCVLDNRRHNESFNHSDNVTMGSMLFELLSSQVVDGNSGNYPFHEDLHLAEGYSYFPDRAPSLTFVQMLEEATAPREDTETLDCFPPKIPLMQEEKNHQRLLDTSPFQIHNEREFIAANFYRGFRQGSDDESQLIKSCVNLQNLGTPLVSNECVVVQHSSPSQSSEPCSIIASGKHIVNNHEESHLIQSSPPTIDEGTSSGTQGPHSSTSANFSENFMEFQPGTCGLPLFVDPTSERPNSVNNAFPERKKRKRSRACKNSEEVESQRMTHIAVERNRRKQMNEHLSVLRSLMPGNYIQRGDQASIIGGAIEFVKELEQVLQSLQTRKRRRDCGDGNFSPCQGGLLSDFMLGPQFAYSPSQTDAKFNNEAILEPSRELLAESRSSVAEVEVKMIGSDASVKVLSQKRTGQLLKTIAAIESLHLSIIHLNITTIDQTILYSFNVKIGVQCQLQTVSELALSIQQIFSVMHADNME